jgi:hypothetical protein
MSLVELMIAVSIMSIGILGFVSAFGFISKAIQFSRARSLGVNLAQEKMENLKNIPYYKLQLSTSTVVYSQFNPPIAVDNYSYPPEDIVISNIRFTRAVSVALAHVDDHYVTSTAYDYPDSGLKYITVYVWWQQGTEWKQFELSNVYENPTVDPLNATVTGHVLDTDGHAVARAFVKLVENPDWADYTAADGAYTIQAQGGDYTVLVASSGYYDTSALNQTLESSVITTRDFTLTAIGSGTLTGNAWLNTHPVISQIVVATNTAVGGVWMPDPPTAIVEYVELFNPTTYNINVAEGGGGSPTNQYLKLDYKSKSGGTNVDDHGMGGNNFNFTYVSTFIPAGRYYLMASATWFMVKGEWIAADAYYGALNTDHIRDNDAGSLHILRPDGTLFDKVGWYGDGGWPQTMEGDWAALYTWSGFNVFNGIGLGNQAVRLSSPCLVSGTYGRAYDSDYNMRDFVYPYLTQGGAYMTGINYKPGNTVLGAAQTVISGVPAVGAYVTANDLIGRSTQAWSVTQIQAPWIQMPYATYALSGVSTGTWTVVVASGGYYQTISSVSVNQGVTTGAVQGGTSPSYLFGAHNAVMLSSYSVLGFLAGSVTDINALPINNIVVRASGSGDKTTNGAGRYFAQVSSGPITATFNPGNQNGIFVEYVTHPDVQTGQVTTQDATLTQGGTLTGYLTTDGNSILPNIKVAATRGGLEYGVGTSDSSGYFYIKNLSTGTYTVAPVLDPLEVCAPASVSTRVSSVSTLFVTTFTVSGAQGKLTGTVTYYGALIKTGALILVSTGSLADTPPTLSAVNSPAGQVIYAGSSKADGTYEIEVRGIATAYNVKVYYPITSATGVTIVKRGYTAPVVAASETKTLNLELPP